MAKNLILKRHLIKVDGMANALLKQMQDTREELKELLEYNPEDLNYYKKELTGIIVKIERVRNIIDDE